jgi:hypothetical protein
MSVLRWDTGLQVRAGTETAEVAAAVTAGSLSAPALGDGKRSLQWAVRAGVAPVVGLSVGLSMARGPFVTRELRDALPAAAAAGSYEQTAYGLDGEYSRGHWLVRGEIIANSWRLPVVGTPRIPDPLRLVGGYVEGRYRLLPRVYVAGRLDRLAFGQAIGSHRVASWDADVTRVETGIGYYLRRTVILKAVYQHNERDGGRVKSSHLGAAQILYWF